MKKYGIFGLLSITLLTGCASYEAANLSALGPQFVQETQEIPGISVSCKSFSQADCTTYLDRDVIKKGYQPVEITFYNQTNKNYSFSTKNLSIPSVPAKEVANKVHTSTLGRVLGYTAGSFLVPALLIPAVVDGICSSRANTKLDQDFQDKAEEQFLIRPHSYRMTLIFVPVKKFSQQFDITLIEEETQTPKVIHALASS